MSRCVEEENTPTTGGERCGVFKPPPPPQNLDKWQFALLPLGSVGIFGIRKEKKEVQTLLRKVI